MTTVGSSTTPPVALFSGKAMEKTAREVAEKETVDNSAKSAMTKIFEDPEVLNALNGTLSQYIPLTTGNLRSMIWGFFNVNKADSINKEDVERGIVAIGGTRTQAADLWTRLDPKDTGEITSLDFVGVDFVTDFVTAYLPTAQANVADLRIQNMIYGAAGTSGTLLDYWGGDTGSGTMLDTIV